MFAAMLAAGLTACAANPKTKTVTRTRTITTATRSTTPTQTTPTSTTTTPSTTSSTATQTSPTAVAPGAPALNGTYSLTQVSRTYPDLPSYPHDGLSHADLKWTVLSGTCSGQQCLLSFRRVLSDQTLETLTLNSNGPTGVFTGTIPGGDGEAGCGKGAKAPITLRMAVRVGGLQQVGSGTVATMLQGDIFADYTCSGKRPTEDVSTYNGVRS